MNGVQDGDERVIKQKQTSWNIPRRHTQITAFMASGESETVCRSQMESKWEIVYYSGPSTVGAIDSLLIAM